MKKETQEAKGQAPEHYRKHPFEVQKLVPRANEVF
jgi:hypothetical protein